LAGLAHIRQPEPYIAKSRRLSGRDNSAVEIRLHAFQLPPRFIDFGSGDRDVRLLGAAFQQSEIRLGLLQVRGR
jgi:hypothetical protein